eukprot:Awhi_evm1s4814
MKAAHPSSTGKVSVVFKHNVLTTKNGYSCLNDEFESNFVEDSDHERPEMLSHMSIGPIRVSTSLTSLNEQLGTIEE